MLPSAASDRQEPAINGVVEIKQLILIETRNLLRRAARLNPEPSLPPIPSSNGLVVDSAFVTKDERAALLACLRKL